MTLELKFTTDKETEHAYPQCANLKSILDRSRLGISINLFPGFSTINCLPFLSEQGGLGFVKNFEIHLGLEGAFPYKRSYPNIRSILNIGSNGGILHFAILKSLDISSFEELAQKIAAVRLFVPEPTASSYFLTKFALESYGITFESINSKGGEVTFEPGGKGHLRGVDAMLSGSANAISGSDYLNSSWISTVGSKKEIKLLPVSESVIASLSDKYQFERYVIPKGSYPFLTGDVLSYRDLDVLATTLETPEEAVYRITKTIVESPEQVRDLPACRFFEPERAHLNIGPLHPGAYKYYREAGYLK